MSDSHVTWYNKYRPKSFDDVVGQDLIKKVLISSIAKDKVKHAYLFTGSKGVGKTTLARIFAHEVNSIEYSDGGNIDIIEMDAASNTSVDDIRLLKESAGTPPVDNKHKIFIIDEVHMLSKSAMNALLKVLEEPPQYLIFLLATTDPQKLLPTILSRITRLNLSNYTDEEIAGRLRFIAGEEGVNFDSNAIDLISKRSEGSMRNAVNLLETVASYDLDNYDSASVAQTLGMLPTDLLDNIIEWLKTNDSEVFASILASFNSLSYDANKIYTELLGYLLDLSLSGSAGLDKLIVAVSETLSAKLPVSDPVSAMALLRSRVGENAVVDINIAKKVGNASSFENNNSVDSQSSAETVIEKKTPIEEKVELPKESLADEMANINSIAQPVVKPDIKLDNDPIQKVAESKPEMVVEKQEVSNADSEQSSKPEQIVDQSQPAEGSASQDSTADNQELNKYYKNVVSKMSDCPGGIASDKSVAFSLESGLLIADLANPLSFASCNNDGVKEWLKNAFSKKFDVDSVALKLNGADRIGAAKKQEPRASREGSGQMKVGTSLPEEVFYKIYKTSKKGLEGKVEVVDEVPNAKVKPKEDELTKVAEEVFDFE